MDPITLTGMTNACLFYFVIFCLNLKCFKKMIAFLDCNISINNYDASNKLSTKINTSVHNENRIFWFTKHQTNLT